MKRGRLRISKFSILRDRALCARFYYWSELQRRRFDDVMYILSHHEFFIGEQSIKDALKIQETYLDELMKKKPSEGTLKRKYPSFSWTKSNNFVTGLK